MHEGSSSTSGDSAPVEAAISSEVWKRRSVAISRNNLVFLTLQISRQQALVALQQEVATKPRGGDEDLTSILSQLRIRF